jgi:hypothetical protein
VLGVETEVVGPVVPVDHAYVTPGVPEAADKLTEVFAQVKVLPVAEASGAAVLAATVTPAVDVQPFAEFVMVTV